MEFDTAFKQDRGIFSFIRKAGGENEIPMTLISMLEDRMLMYKGLQHKYGTQASGHEVIDPKTKEIKWEFLIWPIESPTKVNTLRDRVGFKRSIEESASSMNINKVFSLVL